MSESGRPVAVIVLAAGEGTRMRSGPGATVPKVMHGFAGRSMLGHVIAACAPLEAEQTIVVVGHLRELVTQHLKEIAPAAEAVTQERQDGTGHAVRIALTAIAPSRTGTVVVVLGDTPLLEPDTLAALVAEHDESKRGGHTAHQPAGRSGRVRPGAARRRRQRARRRRAPGRDRRPTPDRRDRIRRLRLRPRIPSRRGRAAVDRQRAGRAVPARCRLDRGAGQPRGPVGDRDRGRDHRGQRPGTTGRRASRLQHPVAASRTCWPASPSSTRPPPGSMPTW